MGILLSKTQRPWQTHMAIEETLLRISIKSLSKHKNFIMNNDFPDGSIEKPFFFKSFKRSVNVYFNDAVDSISDCQKNNYEALEQKLDSVYDDMIKQIFLFYKDSYKYYIANFEEYGFDLKDEEKIIPIPKDSVKLLKHYYPLSIYIPSGEDCSEGTFGIYFSCTWDINNGLGVVIKNWEIDRVGNGDIAFFY